MGSKKNAPKKRSASSKAHSPSKTLKSRKGQSPAAAPSRTETQAQTQKDPASDPQEPTYSHLLPTSEQKKCNGRRVGRSLIMWNRPRMAEKLLLHMQYECARHKIQVPWDAVAHRLRPGSSGAAIMQHLNRLRRDLIVEGHLVPPLAQKANAGGTPHDATIRGYVRADMTGDDRETTRAVKYDEKLEDPKFSLPDAFSADDENEVREEDMNGDLTFDDNDDNDDNDDDDDDDDDNDNDNDNDKQMDDAQGEAHDGKDNSNMLEASAIAPRLRAIPEGRLPQLVARPQAAQNSNAACDFLKQQAETLFDFDDSTSFEDMSSNSLILGHADSNKSFESLHSSQSLQDAFDECMTPNQPDQPGVDDDSPEFGISAAAMSAFVRPSAWDAPASADAAATVPSTPVENLKTKAEPNADPEQLADGLPTDIAPLFAHNAALAYPPANFCFPSAAPSTSTIGPAVFNSAIASTTHALGGMMLPQTMFVLGPGGVVVPMPVPVHLSCGYNPVAHGQYASIGRQHVPSFNGAVPGFDGNASMAGQMFDQQSFNILRAAAAAAGVGVGVDMQQFGVPQVFNAQGLNLNSFLRSMQDQSERVTSASLQSSPVHGLPSVTATPSSNMG